jgi:hypothetical protein
MGCKKNVQRKEGKRRVTYQYDDGRTVVHEEGVVPEENNRNLGELSAACWQDAEVSTSIRTCDRSESAEEFEPGASTTVREHPQVLGGLSDKNGKLMDGTAYALQG